ncbi:MAG: hypothetical protein HYW89_04185 [Candidatus Sungiibacteriota bacterium]|uniref:Uncharacterized protein n=1 Tax=Candidatus Sungiibacteriota bacterium TaxID=2750080 RepID=A0A7T5US07_9BACT|nr:MAG: hypothetical protein HYW89_04185 [Candidatus Sungbacteria bacterium]
MGKFNLNEEDFDAVKKKAEEFYANVGEIYCPYLKEKIPFNAKGLRHLKFKIDQQARPRNDQYARLKLLHLAPQILKESHTLQGIWKTRQLEAQKTNSRWEHTVKEVTFCEFIAVLDRVRAKVIVKEVHGGEKHFWSIIPYWGIDKNNSKRILYSGDPEHD